MIRALRAHFLFCLLAAICFSSSASARGTAENTYIGGAYQNYTGPDDNSLTGSTGYGVTITSTPHRSYFRLLYGASLTATDGRAYLSTTRYAATAYSADAIVGFSIYPIVKKVPVRPFLEVAGLGGFKYIDVTNAPAGAESPSSGLSYGYRLAIGVETNLSDNYGLRVSADYVSNRAKILNTSGYQLDSFGFNLGIFF